MAARTFPDAASSWRAASGTVGAVVQAARTAAASARITGLSLMGPPWIRRRHDAPDRYFVGINASASSANPAAPADGVIHFGKSVMRSAISRTFATPTAWGKKANIGWSL